MPERAVPSTGVPTTFPSSSRTKRRRAVGLAAALAAAALAAAGWAVHEARAQRREMEAALRSSAGVLARTLVPALAAASNAARELDDVVAWKLLDNARLLARLDAADALDDVTLHAVLESNGLDAVVLVAADGAILRRAGAPTPELVDPRVLEVARGRGEETILGWTSDDATGHVAAAAARPGGGAVLVRTDATTAYAFARRLGVAGLLDSTVGTGGVLYLAYSEQPAGIGTEASWDGGPIPPPAGSDAIRRVRDRSVLELDFPIPAPAGQQASLRVGLDADPLIRTSAAGMRRTLLVACTLAGLGFVTAMLGVVARARAVEREHAARRVADSERARQRAERLAAAGALAAGVAHEIRNPLNAIGIAAQRIERFPDPVRDAALAGRIRDEIRRLEEVLDDYLRLARPAPGAREPADLVALANEVVDLLEAEASARGTRLGVRAPSGPVRVRVDAQALRRALVNLVRNAVEAAPAGGAVEVIADRSDRTVRLRVVDDGQGPDPELGDRAFEPFVTTRPAGSGLGLSLVRRVAEEHGGRASLAARPGGGAEAVIELPDEGAECADCAEATATEATEGAEGGAT